MGQKLACLVGQIVNLSAVCWADLSDRVSIVSYVNFAYFEPDSLRFASCSTENGFILKSDNGIRYRRNRVHRYKTGE